MAGRSRHPALRLALVYAALYVFVGVYLPYWPVWLESLELDTPQIAFLLGLGPWVRTLANPIAGRLGTRALGPARLVRLLGFATLAGYACFLFVDGFAAVCAIMILVAVATAPIFALVDGLALAEHVDYGRVRLFGSLGFVAASLLGGWLLAGRAESVIVWTVVATTGAVALATLLTPSPPPPPAAAAPALAEPSPLTMVAIFRRPGFGLFVLACSALHASHCVLYGFGTLHWRGAGIDERTIGALWSVGVVAEIILFALASRLQRRVSPLAWLAVGALAGLLRWPLLASTTALPVLVGAQALHAFTFAAMHLGAMGYLRARFDSPELPLATTLYSAVATGVAYGLAVQGAGLLYDALHELAYLAMGLISGLAMIPIGLLIARGRRDAAATAAERLAGHAPAAP